MLFCASEVEVGGGTLATSVMPALLHSSLPPLSLTLRLTPKIRQDSTRPDKSRPEKTRPDNPGQDKRGQDQTTPDSLRAYAVADEPLSEMASWNSMDSMEFVEFDGADGIRGIRRSRWSSWRSKDSVGGGFGVVGAVGAVLRGNLLSPPGPTPSPLKE